MHYKNILGALVFMSMLLNCKNDENSIPLINIIPQPLEINSSDGYFELNEFTGIIYDDDFKVSGDFLKSYLRTGLNKELNGPHKIQFIQDLNLSPEAYVLNIKKKSIDITAQSDQGAFYAIQSLRQLLPAAFENKTFSNTTTQIPCVLIKDQPEFSYRGMHLDVGRHLFSVDFIKKYIDALAMLKMNTFHWHLTEDQGWRIEIKKYPKLQEIAAYRQETLIGHYNDQPHQFDNQKYGGFYTQEEIKDIVQYANSRFITIIPEIELPGHSQAAIAAYPSLGCTNEPVKVATKWGVFEDIYCPKEETFAFLEDVLDEVLTLFPSRYIHIGGDEAPKTRWKNCDHCNELILREGLKDENELQSYFISRIENYLNSKGRQIIGWDEILEGGLAPNATVMSWRGVTGAVEAAKQQHHVIMTPTSHCYFDYYQSENEQEPLAIGGYLPLEKVYNFNPIPDELNDDETKFVLGAQGNVWTEYMQTSEQVEYMVFPRILAMSETVWSKKERKNYANFIKRLENFHERLDFLDINYANHLYEIQGELNSNNEGLSYHLKTLTEGKTIRFTLDNSEPLLSSKIYTNSILLKESVHVKAALFNSSNKLGETFSQYINLHKAVGQKIAIDTELNESYAGSGAQGLINGISGSNSRYGDKEWLGFSGKDIEITIDFNEKIQINSIKTRFYNGRGQWIYAPKHIFITFNNEEPVKVTILDSEDLVVPVNFQGHDDVKRLSFTIPNYGVISDGKQGAGNKAWTFIDEIIIN
ncbi:family 20 glycosylhydrolase [Flavobacteriaceae bacterium]|nr:family 20 glycosylhydrolase [Flavobacteriaceae bacterium]